MRIWRPKIREKTLRNGLRVVHVKTPSVRTHIAMLFKGGPLFENDRCWGLSHFLEHMVFRGTQHHKDSRAVSLAAERFGGEIGGATYRDRVIYDTRSDADSLLEAFTLLKEMTFCPRFEGADIERQVVHEELLEAYDEDGQHIDADNLSFEHLFGDDPLGRSIDGTLENLAGFNVGALQAFRDACYRVDECVVAVAGPVSSSAVFNAAALFSSLKNVGERAQGQTLSKLRHAKVLKSKRKKRVFVTRTDDSQTQVRLLFRTRGYDDKFRSALSMLARVLDDGPSSRFQTRLIDGRGLAYALWATTDSYRHAGAFEIGAQVQHKKVGELVQAVVDECTALRQGSPVKSERAVVTQRFARELHDLQDRPQTVAESVARAISLGEEFSPATWIEAFQKTTPSQLRRAAQEIFHIDKCALVLVGRPSSKEIKMAKMALESLQ